MWKLYKLSLLAEGTWCQIRIDHTEHKATFGMRACPFIKNVSLPAVRQGERNLVMKTGAIVFLLLHFCFRSLLVNAMLYRS